MASDDLDIPQIAVVGAEDNNRATPTQTIPSPPSDSPHLPLSPSGHATSPTDNQGLLSLPTPMLKSARNSLDAVGSPSSHTSDTSSLQPPPSPTLAALSTGSIWFATSAVLRDNNHEEHDVSITAVVSLSLGLFQDFGQPRLEGEPPVDRVEGVIILVAILIVVPVGSLNDCQKEMQFKVLNKRREERVTKVIRDGEEQMMCYRDFRRWPPDDVQLLDNEEVEYDGLAIDLTLIGITGIEDPLRDGVREAVANRKMAGMSNLNATRTPQLVEPFNPSIFVNWTASEGVNPHNVTAVSVGSKTETALSKFARNLGWANYKDTPNGTNLIPFSSDHKAILYSQSPGEVITPRCMRNVVVFHERPVEQSPKISSHNRNRRRGRDGTTSRDHPPVSRRESHEGNLLASPNVVRQLSTRGQTTSETTAREVDRDISGQFIAPTSKQAGQQQLSTAEICQLGPSNSRQLQPHAVAPSPNAFQSHDENALVENSPPYHEGLPAAVDSTGVLPPNGNGNGAIGSDPFLRDHRGNRAEESTAAREGRVNGMVVYGRRQLSRARDRYRGLFNSVSQSVANLVRRLKRQKPQLHPSGPPPSR